MTPGGGRNVERLLTATLALAAALSVFLRVLDPWGLSHDVALYLDCGALLLDGQKPYVDFADLNPPLVMYLSVLPVALGRSLGVSPLLVTQALVLVGTALSLGAAMRFVRRAGAPAASALALGNGALVADQILVLLDGSAQRDHLFALAALPWLCHRWGLWIGRHDRALVLAILTGVVASLKPQFFVCLFAAELVGHAVARRRPSLDAELAALALVPVIYAAHFALLPRDVRQAFFGRIIPLVVDGYHLWNAPPIALVWICLATGLALAGLGRRHPLIAATGTFALAATAMVWQQHKFWFYHFVPAIFVGLSALGFVLPSILKGATGVAGAVWAGLLAGIAYLYATASWGGDALTDALASRVSPGEGLLVVSGEVGNTYPALLRLDLEPGSRWLWSFPIPILRAERTGAEPSEPEQAFARELSADARTRRPRWLLVLRSVDSPQPRPMIEFDYRAWLESMEPGRALLASYAPVGEVVHPLGGTQQHLDILERR